MKATAEKIEKNKVQLEVEVEPERLSEAINKAYRKLRSKAKIPGFRPGKAPRVVFERYYGKEPLINEALESLLPVCYLEAVKETGIEPVDQPEIDIDQLEEGKPFIFKAKVDVVPEVELGNYQGLEVTKPEIKVSEEDINAELERLRNRYAKLVTLDEGQVEKGDIVTIDYYGTVDGKPFKGGQGENRSIEVGLGFVADDFDENLLGMSLGETRDIKVTLPEDFADKTVAGKEAVIRTTIKNIRRKELAPLDDDFAKDVSEFDTLEELRADLKNKLEKAAEKRSDNAVKEALVRQVVENSSVDLPPGMINSRIDQMMQEVMQPLAQQGITAEQYYRLTNTTEEQMREKLRQDAEFSVKQELVLDAIAQKEDLEVSEEEVEQEIKRLSEFYRQDADKVKEMLEQRDEMKNLKKNLLRLKALDFLAENAKIVEGTEEAGMENDTGEEK
ncbi:MAG: trigger factor [Peptococcaceae bacterium]|nr:trigger factor [Peptococcaceae bacterium]